MQLPSVPPRVLVVDDDPDVRALTASVLMEDGYAVETAQDGASAIARIRAAPPDAIVLDLMMPGLSGQQFLDLYRQLPGPHAPVIVVSAAPYGERQQAALTGADVVLAKPFGTDRLLELVARCLARRGAAWLKESRAA